MKYNKFLKEFEKEKVLCGNAGVNSRGVDLLESKHIKLWMAYKTIETNKKLVWATWFLATTTIVLSIISLILRFG